jgi:hypothetical protein
MNKKDPDRCDFPRCRWTSSLKWLGYNICPDHWVKICSKEERGKEWALSILKKRKKGK